MENLKMNYSSPVSKTNNKIQTRFSVKKNWETLQPELWWANSDRTDRNRSDSGEFWLAWRFFGEPVARTMIVDLRFVIFLDFFTSSYPFFTSFLTIFHCIFLQILITVCVWFSSVLRVRIREGVNYGIFVCVWVDQQKWRSLGFSLLRVMVSMNKKMKDDGQLIGDLWIWKVSCVY